ncbi:sensor histidine kinase [Tenggerimyces flavus]|uniref:histidine kinase n=1 Tax=Tenggerimyces flavus TaxID=1708749 RepID=A0ABV7YE16_9ACTN|nr:ATP-binding protein [Tenggerimyces flavus]MBM7783401.1 signal transduction histidine kinase [Tenggerimyces flavus]
MRWRLPRQTVRFRLTLIYGGLFLACGILLVGMTYFLVAHNTKGFLYQAPDGSSLAMFNGDGKPPPGESGRMLHLKQTVEGLPVEIQQKVAENVKQETMAVLKQQQQKQMNTLLGMSGLALALMTIVAMGAGWIVAGRVLRPLRSMTSTVQRISASRLHDRLALRGPDDELKELGDTFDALLARLESSFEAQRRFVANASHELRTPLARQRAVAQVALADPSASVLSLRDAHERVLASGAEQGRLIDSLLTLARGQAGPSRLSTFDLAALARDVVKVRQPMASARSLHVDARLRPAVLSGDRRLVSQLIVNLVENAIRHNVEGGWLEIYTGAHEGRAVLVVSNGGPVVPPGEVEQLFEPFHRLGADRTNRADGHGLGLSIVQAIATNHQAMLTARAHAKGGLEVEVRFPPVT